MSKLWQVSVNQEVTGESKKEENFEGSLIKVIPRDEKLWSELKELVEPEKEKIKKNA